MFAGRTDWELTQNKITGILEGLKKDGKTVLDLTESNPTNCAFFMPDKDLQAALLNPANMKYVPATKGGVSAREAVAAYYKSKHIDISPEQIFLTASTSEGYSFLFRLLADPGETMLFPQPSYPLFEFLVALNDLEMQFYPLRYKDRWAVDVALLRKMINFRTRGIVVVNPNNPTGSYIKRDELAALNALAHQYRLPLISDEVFFDYSLDDHQFYPSFAGNEDNLTFTLGGLSKTLGLPQMKVSWIVVNGPADLVAETTSRLEIIADTYLSVNTPAQNALPSWMGLRPQIQKEIKTRVLANREFLVTHFTDPGLGTCLRTEGGWYSVVKLNNGIDEESLIEELLLKDHVYVHPGYFFNFEDGSYLVISLLPRTEVFQQGIERIKKRLEAYVPAGK